MKLSTKLIIGFFGLAFLGLVAQLIAMRVNMVQKETLIGNGQVTESHRDFSYFRGFNSHDNLEVHYQTGANYGITIKMDENLHDNLQTQLNGEWLDIFFEDQVEKASSVEVWVTAPMIQGFTARNASRIQIDSTLEQESISIRAEGVGEVHARLKVSLLEMSFRGNGYGNLSGTAMMVKGKASGNSRIQAVDLQAQTADLLSQGDAAIEISVSKSLLSNTQANSTIRYKGPADLTIHRQGNINNLSPL